MPSTVAQLPRTRILLDAAIVFSLANLSLLKVWRELLFASDSDLFYLKTFHTASYIAILLCVAISAALGMVIAVWARRSGSPMWMTMARVGFLLATLVPLNYVRIELDIGIIPIILWASGRFVGATSLHRTVRIARARPFTTRLVHAAPPRALRHRHV